MSARDKRGPRTLLDADQRRSEVPRGGVHPEQPTGGPGGRAAPEAELATYETANRNPSPLPDEPLPPQD